MPKYIIERKLEEPMDEQQILAAAKRSNEAIQELGPGIQWIESYVSGEAIFCVYIADNEAVIREHAFRGELPADRVIQINKVIDPTYPES